MNAKIPAQYKEYNKVMKNWQTIDAEFTDSDIEPEIENYFTILGFLIIGFAIFRWFIRNVFRWAGYEPPDYLNDPVEDAIVDLLQVPMDIEE
ncbi:hypothetical protein J6590_083592 [Homalodisca vitripennis]|nr:hypothetical protein J6590_083592 [Homalodisca vitripennis]